MNNWKRYELKERAKNVLKVNYWIAFVVALIFIIISGGGISGSNSSWRMNKSNYTHSNNEYSTFREFKEEFSDDMKNGFYFDNDLRSDEAWGFTKNFFPWIVGIVAIVGTLAILVSLALNIFVLNPLKMGCMKFFKTSAEEPHNDMRHLGTGFIRGNYKPVVKTMFMRDLYTFLWSLLFVIPGIIKTYSYRMVPYILSDNPRMDTEEAITLSRKMMNGEKWKAFVLDLSFIGWYLLGMLALGVGVLFVNPYKFSVDAQLYLELKGKALSQGLATEYQLNLPTA